jgi:hypothetical protein
MLGAVGNGSKLRSSPELGYVLAMICDYDLREDIGIRQLAKTERGLKPLNVICEITVGNMKKKLRKQ